MSYLNAQRAAQGVPAGIVEDGVLSDGCAKHNAYGRMNGVLVHSEDPSRPGYTPEGDQAARTSVLYAGSGPWTASVNPFETAPIHLHQLLAPRLDRMGASENQGYGCATTLASRNRPAPSGNVTYTYPGDGATGWPAGQLAAEGPYTPGERVGIPAGTRTGPYLYVMFDGPDMTPFDTATASSATLTGPDGPVDVAVVDNHTSGLELYLPTGMEVIPRTPLQAGATYTANIAANVSSQGGGGPMRAFSHTWSFTTGGGGGVANDGFADAEAIAAVSGPVTVTGANVGASKEPGEPNHAGKVGGGSIWFKWTAASSGTTTLDTCGSAVDTLLAAYSGASVGALSEVASNDDATAGFCSGSTRSQISFQAVAGSTYAIAVDSVGGETGDVTLRLAPPGNTAPPDTSTDPGPSETSTLPLVDPIAAFIGSPKSLNVGPAGRFSYRLLATPLSSGKIKLASTKSVKVGSQKRKLKLPSTSFTAQLNASVKVKFKLSRKNLKALKRVNSLRFKVTVTLAGRTFTTKVRLKAPK